MKPATRDLLTGLTALAGVLGFIALLLVFGELEGIGKRTSEYTLRLDTARGLSTTSPVTVNGVRVGSIAQISTPADPTKGVDVRILVDADLRIPSDFKVVIDRSFVGDANLELVVTPGDPDVPPLRDGDIAYRRSLTIIDEIEGRISEPVTALTETAESLRLLASTYTRVGERLETMLKPLTPDTPVDADDPTIPAVLARVDRVLEGVERWTQDESLQDGVRNTVEDTSELLARASNTLEQWDRVASTAREQLEARGEQVAQIGEQLNDVARRALSALTQIDATAGSLESMAKAAAEGEGTVAQLLNNPDLYRSVTGAARRLDMATRELQLLIEKYRSEGVPVQF